MRIIAGAFKNQILSAPKGLTTRPTSSMLRGAVFNICSHKVEDSNFLDLFAGSGAMGIEALSRGAAKAVFIDQSLEAMKCIKQNLEKLKIQDQGQVLRGDIWKMLDKLVRDGTTFQLIYVDPPYSLGEKKDFWEQLGKIVMTTTLLDENGMLFIEQGKDSPKPDLEGNNLKLISSRNMGAATLHQYQKQEA